MSAARKSEPGEPTALAHSTSWQHARTTFDSFAAALGRLHHHRREDALSLGVYLIRLAGQHTALAERRRLSERPLNHGLRPKIDAEAQIIEGEIVRTLGELERLLASS
jgi:hypothetical protein